MAGVFLHTPANRVWACGSLLCAGTCQDQQGVCAHTPKKLVCGYQAPCQHPVQKNEKLKKSILMLKMYLYYCVCLFVFLLLKFRTQARKRMRALIKNTVVPRLHAVSAAGSTSGFCVWTRFFI
jgi:hypothetical protein